MSDLSLMWDSLDLALSGRDSLPTLLGISIWFAALRVLRDPLAEENVVSSTSFITSSSSKACMVRSMYYTETDLQNSFL